MTSTSWIKDMLEKRGVAYELLHHRVAFTAQEVARSEHVSGDNLAKVVVVIADGRPVELIVPASRRVELDRVRKLLCASAIRLASEAEMERIFTDCETGAIPPLRHWKDVTVLMDTSMSNAQDLVFQAGTHEDAVRLKFQDWFALVKRASNTSACRSTPRPRPPSRTGKTRERKSRGGRSGHGPRNRNARADSPGAVTAGSTWWDTRECTRPPGHIPGARLRCAPQPSLYTASGMKKGERSKAGRN